MWAFRVTDGERTVFESRTVSIRFRTEAAARWLAGLTDTLVVHGIDPPGCRRAVGHDLEWFGTLHDDCYASAGRYYAHAEHLDGAVDGGHWFCGVTEGCDPEKERLRTVFHSSEHWELWVRNGRAGRWLCELMIKLDRIGLAPGLLPLGRPACESA